MVTLVTLVETAAPAAATEVTTERLRRLVERAPFDPAALAELRAVDRVDGAPVDLGRALAGVRGADLRTRLDTLAEPRGATAGGGAAASATDGDAARAEARRILAGRRFQESPVPRPLRGVLRWLGDALRPIGEPLGRAWDRLTANAWAMGALAVTVVLIATAVSARAARRRTAAGVARGRGVWRAGRAVDPDELERAAAAAEAAGDLATALRLRFRAGVVRLDRAGVVSDRPALTAGELTRHLPSPGLRILADAFEEVAYGGRPATPGDVDEARTGWPRVLDEAARR